MIALYKGFETQLVRNALWNGAYFSLIGKFKEVRTPHSLPQPWLTSDTDTCHRMVRFWLLDRRTGVVQDTGDDQWFLVRRGGWHRRHDVQHAVRCRQESNAEPDHAAWTAAQVPLVIPGRRCGVP